MWSRFYVSWRKRENKKKQNEKRDSSREGEKSFSEGGTPGPKLGSKERKRAKRRKGRGECSLWTQTKQEKVATRNNYTTYRQCTPATEDRISRGRPKEEKEVTRNWKVQLRKRSGILAKSKKKSNTSSASWGEFLGLTAASGLELFGHEKTEKKRAKIP